MGFNEAYKRLEKLCGEIMNDDRRISAYIDEMRDMPNGAFYVPTWETDLKMLKHYRWIRNQISHDPGCTEENMCKDEDVLWLEDFYCRIIDGEDPLTLYRKAIPKTKQSYPLKNTAKKEYASSDGSSILWFVGAFILLWIILGWIFK